MRLFKCFVSISLLIAVLSVAVLPAFAQGPTGATADDALSPTCDWVYMSPSPMPGYYSDIFYKVPYAKNTQLVIYISATKVDPNKFFFDVYTPYDASLTDLFSDPKVSTWHNWVGLPVGRSTPNDHELGDLSWAGKLNNGVADGYYIVDVINFFPEAVWYNLCYRSYYNF